MAWDKGFNFRATAGYVTDPADTTYVLHTDVTSTTRNGVTFLWTDNGSGTLDSRDRSSVDDPRLAGINFIANTSAAVFQVTLPATGAYDLFLAAGDQGGFAHNIDLEWGDGGSYTTISNNHAVAVNSFIDATNAERTAVQWVSDSARGGTALRIAMTTTVFQLRLGGLSAAAEVTTVAHLFISQVGESLVATPLQKRFFFRGVRR